MGPDVTNSYWPSLKVALPSNTYHLHKYKHIHRHASNLQNELPTLHHKWGILYICNMQITISKCQIYSPDHFWHITFSTKDGWIQEMSKKLCLEIKGEWRRDEIKNLPYEVYTYMYFLKQPNRPGFKIKSELLAWICRLFFPRLIFSRLSRNM